MDTQERTYLWTLNVRDTGTDEPPQTWGVGRTRREAVEMARDAMVHDADFDRASALEDEDEEGAEWAARQMAMYRGIAEDLIAEGAGDRWFSLEFETEWSICQIEKPDWMQFAS